METFCKDCKFIKEPEAIQDGIGKTWSPYKCECPLNKTTIIDWYGNSVDTYTSTPYEMNKEHDCHMYENAITGETNPEPIPEPPPSIPEAPSAPESQPEAPVETPPSDPAPETIPETVPESTPTEPTPETTPPADPAPEAPAPTEPTV